MTQTEASGEPAGPAGASTEPPPAEHYDPGPIPTVTPTEHFEGKATKETLEDYTLRFAPRSYRRWGTGSVGHLGARRHRLPRRLRHRRQHRHRHGTTNALWGILIAAVIIFVTGFPLAYYAARYNIDLDLITRGSPASATTGRCSPT